MKKTKVLAALIHVLTLCVVIFTVSVYFIENASVIGYVLVLLGFFCVGSLKLFRTPTASLGPDIVFGVIDNGILAIMAIFGGQIAGVVGAVIGGVVGNAITDGIAGVFEGYYAESFMTDRRTVLSSAVGKMAGCLFGAGAILIVQGLF